ncbi:MAG: histidine kinase [Betaproteobacteria bacterium]|nr:histidine kinase [Betaproteobacteria bacterium]
MTFRYGHAVNLDWAAAVDALVVQLGRDHAGEGLGFVYIADQLGTHADDILRRLRAATGVQEWVGTVGIGIIATGIEYMDEPAIAAMITDWPRSEFSVFSGRARAPVLGDFTPSGADAAHFAIIHADPNTADMPELIEDMSRKTASGFVVGGLSSSRAASFQIANEVLRGGLSGVLLSSAIAIHTRHTQGCSPLPGRHVITEVNGNVIATIDGRPALDVFREVVGPELARDLRRAAFTVLAGLPVAASDTGDYLVRNVVGIDPKNKLLAIGAEVEAGQPLLFCTRGGDSARLDLERMLGDLSDALPGPAKGGVYIACVGRGEHMFGKRSAELGLIRQCLGDVPIVGFFANGEISHDRLYGYTGVLTLFT